MKEKEKETPTWLLILLLCIPVVAVVFSWIWVQDDLSPKKEVIFDSPANVVETYLSSSIPFAPSLRQGALDISYIAGKKEQNGVFISKNRLMKNVSTIDGTAVEENNAAIVEFVEGSLEKNQLPYLMIVPSATGVLRQKVPAYTEPVNQRNFIDNVYNQLTDVIPTIDVYNTLLLNQEKYIYYRTENNITPIGGYYIFEQLNKRMLGEAAPARNQYNVVYERDDYYGDLFGQAPYRKVKPDVLMKYEYSGEAYEYLITQIASGVRRQYHTLYPTCFSGLDMRMYLGGSASTTVIRSAAAGSKTLLLLGDETALSYLPFLAHSYKKITFLDMTEPRTSSGVTLADFNHILIACSAQTYMSGNEVEAILELL